MSNINAQNAALATSAASEPAHSPDVRKCPKMSDLGELSQLDRSSLNAKQQIALRLLLTGKPLGGIARQLDIDVRTLHRWRQDSTFRRTLNRLRRQLWGQALDRLRALVHPSLDVLEQNLRDTYNRGRMSAANAVLRHANLRKCVPLEHLADFSDDESPDNCEDSPDEYDY